jgi:hypothetical protein
MNKFLEDPITVDFDNLGLDPNNPRLGRKAPGYDDPTKIFDAAVQNEIHEEIQTLYDDFEGLKEAILAQGWLPVDTILVWRHAKKDSHFILVEGNTRKTALRQIREELNDRENERAKLVKRKVDPDIIEAKDREIKRYQDVVAATQKLIVVPVKAKDSKELEEILPRILGVRHIKHPRQWGPYPQNLFILREYQKRFHAKHGASKKLALDDDIISTVAGLVSEGEMKTRRGIQSAFAFSRFKQRWADKLPPKDEFSNEDHYFFEQILQGKYAKTQFRFDDNKLEMDPDMEEVLFKWAFSKPRNDTLAEENPNIFHKAENIRDWNKMATYDSKNKTAFATQLDVSAPDAAPSFKTVYAQFLDHQASKAPTNLFGKLIQELKKLTADSLMHGAEHLKPQLDEIVGLATNCRKMMESVGTPAKAKSSR